MGSILPTPCPSDGHPYNKFNFFLNLFIITFGKKQTIYFISSEHIFNINKRLIICLKEKL